MLEVITGNTPGRLLSADILDSMFRLRNAAFSERLGWEVQSFHGRETDRFDELRPTYMIARDRRRPQRALGCWRLLPTTGSYMLRDVFPELLDGNPIPSDPRVWEISRYAVTPDAGAICPGFGFGDISVAMWRRLFSFSQEAGIDAFVAVTTVSVERLVARLGLTIQRFGPARRIGNVLSVAFRLPMDGRARTVLGMPAADLDEPARAA
ncbi:MAG TPA: acyl-homoserine-lactone synthase [Rhodanobacteraceae bacterium]|nr:acyl-homoserine-lactone synthase [Rhodanobacteraceae bacterium]